MQQTVRGDKYRLCYAVGSVMYFTDNIRTQWGDDWDDAPADCNAEPPYSDENHHIRYLAALPWELEGTAIMRHYSVQDIIKYRMTFFEKGNDEIKAGMTMKKVMTILGKHHIPFGELVEH